MSQYDDTARLSITDLALREHLGYYQARDRVLKGQYGPVVREGGRLYVIGSGAEPDTASRP